MSTRNIKHERPDLPAGEGLSEANLRAARKAAKRAGLRYVDDDEPGIHRVKQGRGFRYQHSGGRAVRDAVTLQRIRALVIPPAWTDVWICRSPTGHLQATGRDARGRKQYRYHEQWRTVRDASKYAKLLQFGALLPRIRRRVRRDLALRGLPRNKVLAVVIRLMELTHLRVGNEEYARTNGSFGLTTLRDRHVEVHGSTVRFSFMGKSNKLRNLDLQHPALAKLVKQCRDVPGYTLFQYYDEQGRRRRITSNDVNDYLRSISGADVTAKDFRTWAGTLLAAHRVTDLHVADSQLDHSERAMKARVAEVVRGVADRLGNTAAVCRKAYIHPSVLEAVADARLRRRLLGSNANPRKLRLPAMERVLLRFMEHCETRAAA